MIENPEDEVTIQQISLELIAWLKTKGFPVIIEISWKYKLCHYTPHFFFCRCSEMIHVLDLTVAVFRATCILKPSNESIMHLLQWMSCFLCFLYQLRIEVHFFSLHWEMKGHWSRVNLLKREPNAKNGVCQCLCLCLNDK